MSQKTVLLVRPLINRRRNAPFFLPLGLLCVASPLREAGFDVAIVDYEYLYRSGQFSLHDERWLADMCDPLLAREPLLIGLTALADTLPVCLLMGQYLKRVAPEVTVALGGPGVFGSFPAALDRFADAIDYVCINEGERCLLELAERLAGGEARPRVAGFYARIDGAAAACSGRELADLDSLPMPAYDLLPVPEYLDLASPRIFDIYLGSGCTYACKFCVTAEFWERDFRSKSPDLVLRELDFLHARFGITQVNFLHDNFANRKRYLDDFIDHFLAHNSRYVWGCAVRPDNVTRDQLARMRRAGCFNVFCGTDTGSRRLLREMAKMPDASRSYGFFRDCQAVGLPFETNTIIGYPGESDDDLEESLRMIFSAVAHGGVNSDVSVLQPLPGAHVTRDYRHRLEFLGDMQLGTFTPPEALELTRAAPDLFSGFYFIRHKNRPFDWYVRLSELIRFFTRHWFRTLYFLVEACGLRYVDVLSGMMDEADPGRFSERFERLVAGLPLPDAVAPLARSVLRYDQVEERLRARDISREVENIYSVAPASEAGRRHELIELPHAVHQVFAGLPALDLAAAAGPATYLWYRDDDGQVSTIRLRPWQRALWQRVELQALDRAFLDALVAELHGGQVGDPGRASAAVRVAVDLFAQILSPGPAAAAASATAESA